MKSYLRPTAASRNRSRPVLQDVTNRQRASRKLGGKVYNSTATTATSTTSTTGTTVHSKGHVYKDGTSIDNSPNDNTKTVDQDTIANVVPVFPIYNDHNRKQVNEIFNMYENFNWDDDDDDDDLRDPNMVMEYHRDIFQHLHELEIQFAPDATYMSRQLQLNWSYRTELVDWLVKVHAKFQLLPETLFLTINIMDRFLSHRVATLNRFQLVGITSLFIASKYEEIYAPTLNDLVHVLNGEYNRDDIIQAERFMITTLNFQISWPGPMSFLRKLSKADDYNYGIRSLSKFFLENCIMDARLIASPPSWLASGAYFLSKIVLIDDSWSASHILYSGYTRDQLLPLIMIIIEICEIGIANKDAIYYKYSTADDDDTDDLSSQNYVKIFQDWLQLVS